ncbi:MULTISPECIES: ABC transporter substrate-binding protein [unclassified Microbacterium]|uniref:ABC transporter substrate-binding protein n=1 Tax=unclassified Microbacterium TaxID=2609290 RepID=UPI00097F650A|nr:ABC transporter substrate-binding protein [Microbacterium sp. JB110]SJM58832.1 Hydroxymethylpyrimidine ABC transporter, substrate-binding component [Frigoribacterium sp. JB110]
MHITTRTRVAALALAGAAALTLASCGSEPQDGDALELIWAQPTPESMAYFPVIVAEENGYFEDEGVAVEVAPASEDLPTSSLVASGSADIAAASAGEIFFALASDPSLAVVYDATRLSPEGIVVPAGGDIVDVSGLDGATIGISSDEERALIASALDTAGLTLDDVTLVTVGGGGQVIANELDGGQFDAFAGSVLDFAAVQAVGYELQDITPESIAETPSGAFVIGEEADDAAVEGFLRAVARGTDWGLQNPDELEQLLRERVPEEWENEEVARSLFEFGLDGWSPREGADYGQLDAEVWQETVQRLTDAGELTEEVDLDALLDDRFIAPANDALGDE